MTLPAPLQLENIYNKLIGSLAVTGTFWQSTQPVSISGTINTADAANGSATGGTAATVSELQGGVYNTALPTLTNGQQCALQSDSSGRLLTTVNGNVNATLSGTVNGYLSNTSVALGAPADTAWTSGSGSTIAILKTIAGNITGGGNPANGSVTGGTAGTYSTLSGLIYNTSLPTLTNGQQAALQSDSSGRLIVNIGTNGTVIANLGTTDTANLASVVTETTAIAGAAGTTADSAWVSGSGSIIALLKNIANKLAGSVAVTGTFYQVTQPVSGSVTATLGSTDTANLALIADAAGTVTNGTAGTKSLLNGGIYNTSLPTLTNGQQAALQSDSSGRLFVNVATGSITANLGATDTGNLATVVTETTAAASALGTPADASWNGTGSGSVVAILKSISIGPENIQFNTTLPTLSTGATDIMQSDNRGRLLIGSIASALPIGTNNIGSVTNVATNTSGNYSNVSVTTSSTALVTAAAAKVYLDITNPSGTQILWISIGGTASVGGAGCIPITPYGSKTWEDNYVPADAITAIFPTGTQTVVLGIK